MANGIDINKIVGDLKSLNDEMAKTSANLADIISKQAALNTEINKSKGLKDVTDKLNQSKKAQNQIEIEGEKLLRQRNSLMASQQKAIEKLTKDVIKERIEKKKYIDAITEEITGEKAAKKAKQESAKAAKEKAAAEKKAAIESAKAAKISFNNSKEGIRQSIKEKEAKKQLINEVKKEEGLLKKRSGLFASMTKSILASVTAIGLITQGLKAIWQALQKTQGFQNEWNKGMAAANAGVKVLFGSIKELVNGNGGFNDFNKRLDAAIDRAYKLQAQLQLINLYQIAASKQANEQRMIEELWKSVADDATRSFQQRGEANEKAYQASLKRANIELDINKQLYENQIEQNRLAQESGILLTTEQIKLAADYRNAYDKSRVELKKIDLDYNKFKRELALDDFEQQLDYLFDVSDKRKTANEKLIADDKLTATERIKILEDTKQILQESFDQQIKLFNDFHGIEIDTNKLLTLNNNEVFEYVRGLGMSERATNRLLEVIRERIAANSDILEAQKNLNESIALEDVQTIKLKSDIQQKITDDNLKQLQKRYEANLEYLQKIEADEKASAERKKQIRQEFINTSIDLGNTLFDLAQSQREIELSQIQANYDARIAAAEGNTELQERLAKELEQEQARIAREQAQSEKNQALFNVAINTAQGIAKAVAESPLTFGLPFSAFVATTGLLQAALIQSQPIPGFFTGTEDAPAGLKWVAERGSELIEMPSGDRFLAKDKMLINTEGHEKIFNHADTMQEINNAIYRDIAMGGNNKGIEDRLDLLISKSFNQEQLHLNIDENGFNTWVRKGQSITHYLNRRVRK